MRELGIAGLIIFGISIVLHYRAIPLWFFPGLLTIFLTIGPITAYFRKQGNKTIAEAEGTINITAYILLTFAAVPNHIVGHIGQILIILGLAANFVVTAANDWKMPVKTQRAEMATAEGYTFADQTTRFFWLCDCIPLPRRRMTSVGDILMSAGYWLAAAGIWLMHL